MHLRILSLDMFAEIPPTIHCMARHSACIRVFCLLLLGPLSEGAVAFLHLALVDCRVDYSSALRVRPLPRGI